MKNKKTKKKNFSFRPGAAVYAVLFLYALIMTQLLRSTVSNVFFWFMLSAAPVSLLHMLLGKAAIQVYVHSDVSATQKGAPVEYEIRIINHSPLPFPFVEATVVQPEEGAVRCVERRMVLSVVPFDGYSVKQTVRFPFRGLYEIGVGELYITDVLHLFRLRVEQNNFSNVTVSPRVCPIYGEGGRSVSDIPTPAVRTVDNRDLSELNNIREYRNGDSLKSVHWKLSTKSEELQVKEFSTNTDRHTYIFADMSAPTPPPELEREKTESPFHRALSQARNSKSVKNGFSAFFSVFKRKGRKNRTSSIPADSNTDYDKAEELIERLISQSGAKKEKNELFSMLENNDSPIDTLRALDDVIGGGSKEDGAASLDEAKRRWGGVPKEDLADEMPEFCADGVAEITVSAVARELKAGNKCTVVWFGRDGICARELRDHANFEDLCHDFATTPVVSKENRLSVLTDVIGEASNVTVKIVTANIDPVNLASYCSVPCSFGGSGGGCVTEVLLFNPSDRYESPSDREDYAVNCMITLRHAGADLLCIHEKEALDGGAELWLDRLM